MATRVLERVEVPLPAARAQALWIDVSRWAAFVEGFRHPLEVTDGWPEPGSSIVWESTPGGRGRVTERVREHHAGRLVTEVFEERMSGVQSVGFEDAGEGRARVQVELEYELTRSGPLRAVANALFIRRAIGDSLARTLRRFAAEAGDEVEPPL